VKVRYTIEQCWHDVPGGTAVAAVELARALMGVPDVELIGWAARHDGPPARPELQPPFTVRHDLLPRDVMYARWLWGSRRVVRPVDADVVHATTVLPPPVGRVPLVATVHDLAFMHDDAAFTARGLRTMRRGWDLIAREAAVICCSSQATFDDCAAHGAAAERLRVVPLGVRPVDGNCSHLELPSQFVLFVGTAEPRKNLARLVAAMRQLPDLALVVAGPAGWGDVDLSGVHRLGYVDDRTKAGLYARASVVAYPSLREGFGLPVLEAMAQGATVVTSAGTSCAEVAGDAAVLVDPLDVDAIAAGIRRAIDAPIDPTAARTRAGEFTWQRTAQLTIDAYRTALT
jgi:glycosyltransferase involved in cell wall biosynthesis